MTAADPLNSLHRLAELGEQVLRDKIRPVLRPEDDGNYVAVDVKSGDYEVHKDDYQAVTRLRTRVPTAEVWLARAGHPTTYTMRTLG